MRRLGLLAVALLGLVVMAATPNVIDNVQRIMKGGFQAGPATTLARTQNKVTAMLTADVDYDFASSTIVCTDTPAVTVTGAKVGDPCFVGIGPADGGTQVLTNNSVFTCFVDSDGTAKLRHCAVGTAANPADAGYQLRIISSH